MIATRSKDVELKKYQRVWCYVLIAVGMFVYGCAFVLSLDNEVAEAFSIPTRSMNLTFQPGDRVLVDKLWYRFAPLERGDLAVFYSKGPGSSIHAHRVIGLPSDVIEIRNEKLYLNGSIQDEPYARFKGEMPPSIFPATMNNMGPITVPAGQFFQMGDHRRRAIDSRTTGCVPIEDIVGRVQIIYWSRGEEDPDADPDPDRFEIDRFSRLRPTQPSKTRIRWERIGLRPNG
jgi:signal peptidase I